jgi:hypothetical protein
MRQAQARSAVGEDLWMRAIRLVLLVAAIAAGAAWVYTIAGSTRQLSAPVRALRAVPASKPAAAPESVAAPDAPEAFGPSHGAQPAVDARGSRGDARLERRPAPGDGLTGAQIMRLLEDELAGTDAAATEEVLRAFDESLPPAR